MMKVKQYEAVIKVMEENGGYATLRYLYENVPNVPNVIWKTKTPFASIRRIVQDKRFFFKIKPGLWALKSYRNRLTDEILSLMEDSKDKEVTHAYYQGLLVEIGNLKGLKTYVPPQDKNKKFIDKTLDEIVNLDKMLNFTYEDIIQKTKSIDVFWFNERRFPSAVFEIEHTTNFKNSLLKFLELQDFNTRMYIVSSEARKKEFEHIMSYTSFQPIKYMIRFINYETVSHWYSKAFELMLIERGQTG